MIDLLEGEKIVLQKRRHWYALATESSGLFLMALVPVLLILLGMSSPAVREIMTANWNLILFMASVWLLMVWMIFFVVWTNYYLDVLVVTNYRLIDIEQKGLFARDMAEVHLSRIQDVKVEVVGLLASLMDFGDIHVQTAGAEREVVITRIEHPHKVRDMISQYHMEVLNKR
ncbi:MAG: PH domain-containing protein [Candidatus Spechtbacterales bacterium]